MVPDYGSPSYGEYKMDFLSSASLPHRSHCHTSFFIDLRLVRSEGLFCGLSVCCHIFAWLTLRLWLPSPHTLTKDSMIVSYFFSMSFYFSMLFCHLFVWFMTPFLSVSFWNIVFPLLPQLIHRSI
jgi:hypothetical protein